MLLSSVFPCLLCTGAGFRLHLGSSQEGCILTVTYLSIFFVFLNCFYSYAKIFVLIFNSKHRENICLTQNMNYEKSFCYFFFLLIMPFLVCIVIFQCMPDIINDVLKNLLIPLSCLEECLVFYIRHSLLIDGSRS